MSEIRFEQLPERATTKGNNQSGDSQRIASALKARPGEWAAIKSYDLKQHSSARGYSARVNGGKTGAFAPAGHFEAATRQIDGEIRVYARFVGQGGAR